MPESLALLAWMVALVPFAFLSLAGVATEVLNNADDTRVSIAFPIYGYVWLIGLLLSLVSLSLPWRRTCLALATAAFAAPVVYLARVLIAS